MTSTSEVTVAGDADGAVVSGQCAEDAPDCEDTEATNDGAPDGPDLSTVDGGADADSLTGMPADGGLSVSEALDSEAADVLAVRGHLYDEGAGAALCETLAGGGERYVCAGPLLAVEGLDLRSIGEGVIIHDGLTYTEEEITLFGRIVDGILVVDPDSS